MQLTEKTRLYQTILLLSGLFKCGVATGIFVSYNIFPRDGITSDFTHNYAAVVFIAAGLTIMVTSGYLAKRLS